MSVQIQVPDAVKASIRKSPYTIQVSWEKLRQNMSFEVLGYKIRFHAFKQNGEDAVNTSSRTVTVKNMTGILLVNLIPFTTYAIQVAAITDGGDGNYSDFIYGGKHKTKKPLLQNDR